MEPSSQNKLMGYIVAIEKLKGNMESIITEARNAGIDITALNKILRMREEIRHEKAFLEYKKLCGEVICEL